MKKIFAILALFFAFSISAIAQDVQKNIDTATAADFAALNKVIPVPKKAERDIKEAFYAKHKLLTQTDLTAEQKTQISTETETKLSELLSPEQFKKLKANKELFKKLVH